MILGCFLYSCGTIHEGFLVNFQLIVILMIWACFLGAYH